MNYKHNNKTEKWQQGRRTVNKMKGWKGGGGTLGIDETRTQKIQEKKEQKERERQELWIEFLKVRGLNENTYELLKKNNPKRAKKLEEGFQGQIDDEEFERRIYEAEKRAEFSILKKILDLTFLISELGEFIFEFENNSKLTLVIHRDLGWVPETLSEKKSSQISLKFTRGRHVSIKKERMKRFEYLGGVSFGQQDRMLDKIFLANGITYEQIAEKMIQSAALQPSGSGKK